MSTIARPRKTGLDYFPHDCDATTDPKLEPSIMRYGAAAYAFYFMHLEYCYRAEDLSIDISDTEMGQEMREVIQQKLRITEQEYENILKSLLRHGAFDNGYYQVTGKLTSNGVKKRAAKVLEKRARSADQYAHSISAAEIGAETTQSIEKKSKEKQRKGEENKGNNDGADAPSPTPERHKRSQYGWVKLTDDEYNRLIKDFGEETVLHYIAYVDESAQQTGNKNKWKDWNLTIRKAIKGKWGGDFTPQKYGNNFGESDRGDSTGSFKPSTGFKRPDDI